MTNTLESQIDELTGLPKSVHIEYFLNEKSLGKTMVSEGSMSINRINEAKNIGIEYYDGFVLDNGSADSRNVKLTYNGKLEVMNDFKVCDKDVD